MLDRRWRLKGGRHRLLLLVPLTLLLTVLPLSPASGQTSDPSALRIARVSGNEYVFDTPITAAFAEMVTCDPTKYARFTDFCKVSSEEVGGTTYEFSEVQVSWDKNNIDNGSIAYARNGSVMDLGWWQDFDSSEPGWTDLATTLRGLATTRGDWNYVDLYVLKSPSPSGGPLAVPIPELELAKMRMIELAKDTTTGSYYPVQVPSDLAGFRAQMLAYGNAGRRDPDFRRNNGSTTAVDLSLDTVDTLGGPNKVFRENSSPPYFSDQVPDPVLDAAAQFQAEYNADRGKLGHDGPRTYTDSTGKSGPMSSVSQRSVFFSGPPNVVEGAGQGAPGNYPHSWMKSETHFRPFFNVAAASSKVGFGAAMDRNGDWHFVFVPTTETELPTKTVDEVTLPAEIKVGATGSDSVLKVKAAEPPPESGEGPTIIATQPITPPPSDLNATTDTSEPDPIQPSDGGTAVDGVPQPTFEAGCAGFGAYLRQEVASREATRVSGPGCSFDSPDLQEAVLEIAPRVSFPNSDVACEDVAQGRVDDPQSAAVIDLRSQSSAGVLSAVTSSGSTERSFPFLFSAEAGDVASFTLSCDEEFVYRARLRRDAGVNPLLTVNSAAEGMRRADDAGGDASTTEEPTTAQDASTAGAGNTTPETTDGGSPEIGKLYVHTDGRYFLLESAGTIRLCPEGDAERSFQNADLTKPQDARSEGITPTNEPCDTDDSGTVLIVPATVGAVYADRQGPGEFRYVKITSVSGSGSSARVSFDVCNGGSGDFGIMAMMEVARAEAAGRSATNETCPVG